MTQSGSSDSLLRRQSRKGVLRETLLEDGDTVVKRFLIPHGTKTSAKPWLREHRALSRLGDVASGRSFGFEQNATDQGVEIVLRKAYVPGARIERLSGPAIARFAELLARLHQCGVVMCDPNLENFVLDEVGAIHCIDFGRSATYASLSPFLFYGIGSEFAKCIHEAFDDDQQRWAEFLEAYFAAFPHGPLATRLILLSFNIARRSRASRDRRRED